jgi:hypothetical protein
MRKLILILTLSLSFFNNSHSAENLFCIDLDSKSQWDDFYSIYQIFNKGKSDECSASNLGEGLKNKKLVKFDYENYKKYHNSGRSGQISTENLKKYLKEKNLLKELEYIKLAESNPVVNSNKTNVSSAKSQNTSCYKMLEWSWKIPNNFAEFSFTNKGEGNIRIDSIKIKTEDGRQVLEESVFINLKPFGIGSSRVFIGDRNKEMLAKAGLTCAFISETKTKNGVKLSDLIDDKNSRSDKKSFFENYITIIIIALIVLFIVFVGIIEETKKNNRKNSNTFSQSSQNIKSTPSAPNLIELVWNGSLPLGQTFWFYYVVVNIIVGFVAGFLMEIYESKWIFIIPGLTGVWAGVGTWNSATNYQLQKIKSQQPYGWVYGAKAVVVFGFINLAGQLVKFLK